MRIPNLTVALCLCLSLLSNRAQSQNSNVSIGTPNIKSGAVLWLKANGNQGLLLPAVSNRSAFSGLNNSDDKGMVVFDLSDNKIYYWDGSAWVGVGSGSSAANQVLSLGGNTISLTGSPASNISISSAAPTTGQALVWNGTAWTSISLAGDVSGAVGSTAVGGLKGKALPALPSSSNALVYDGTNWVFQPLSSSGEANTASNVGTGGASVFKQKTGVNLEFNKLNAGSNRVTVTSDAPNSEIDIDVVQANLSLASSQITGLGTLATASTVNSALITDGAITGADIATNTITTNKIAPSGAVLNDVLKWDGTNWVPGAATGGGSGTVTQVSTGTGLAGGPITATGTISIAAGGVGTTELAPNAVTSAKITDGTVTGTDIAATTITGGNIAATTITSNKLAQSGATTNQVLQWNGTNWVPANTGTGSVTSVATGTGLTGGPITATGTISIAAGGVGTTELGANAVTSAKIIDATITGTDIAAATVTGTNIAATTITGGNIAATTITGGNIAATTITSDKLAQSGAATNQVLQWNGTNWVPAPAGTGSVTSVTTGTGLTGGPITTTGTISISAGGVGTTELGANAVTSAKITDATITGTDIASATVTGTNIAATTITGGNIAATTITANKLAQSGATPTQILQWNGTNWVPANAATGTVTSVATGTGLTGGPISATGTISIAAGGVGTTELANNSVTSAKILDNEIVDADVSASANILGTKINPNFGDLTVSTTGTASIGTLKVTGLLSVGIAGDLGTPGQVLTSQGPGTAPTWTPIFNALNEVPRGDGTTLVSSNIYSNGTSVGIGNTTPTAKLDVTGTVKIVDGTQGANKVLTSDVNGLASWQNLAASSAGILAGTANTGIGTSVQQNLTTGTYNSGFGTAALAANTTASWNSAFGANALLNNAGPGNSSVGYYSLGQNLAGQYNAAVGWHALYSNTTGNDNVGLGRNAGEGGNPNSTGNNNVFIGSNTGFGVAGPFTNAIAIGYNARVSQSNTMALGGTGASAVKVGIGTETPRSILELVNGNLILAGSVGAPNDPVDIDFKTHQSIGDIFKAKIWTDPNTNTLWASTSTTPTTRKDLTIDPNGNVGIGTTAPSSELQVGSYSASANDETFTIATQGGSLYRSRIKLRHFDDTYGWTIESDERTIYNGSRALVITAHFASATGVPAAYILGNGRFGIARIPTANMFEVEGEASKTVASSWLANSDRRIKTDIQNIDNSFELIKQLRPVKFKYTDEWKAKHPSIKDQYYYNFIAQEYQQVFPESVKQSGEFLEGDKNGILQIDTYNAQITTIKAVQELITKVEQLEKENARLKSENGLLESKLNSYDENQKTIQKDIETLKEMIGLLSSKK